MTMSADAIDSRLRRAVRGLFGSPLNTAITLAVIAIAVWLLPPLLRWAVLDATWTGTAEDCAAHGGACWTFVWAKLPFMSFAFYPPAEHWRPALAMVLILVLLAVTGTPGFWGRHLIPVWIGAVAGICLLMAGFGPLPIVPTDRWGGLALTLFLSTTSYVAAFPLALLLALARRSNMRGLRLLAIAFIEIVRGVPMIAVLYVAMLLVPMMLPEGFSIDKFLRVAIAATLFVAAYLAEIIRGGLQSVPQGQYEAAQSLGLGYWSMMRLVILPPALRTVIPALVNLAIGIVLNTSLVAVVGIFDLLNAARVSATDPQWLGYYDEAFIYAGAVYFVLCFSGSRYSLWLEHRLARSSLR